MQALRAAARKRAESEPALAPAWDALVRGELDEEERAALREQDPELAAMFEPLDEAFVDGLVDEFFPAESSAEETADDEGPPPSPEAAPIDADARVPSANRPARWLMVLAPVAALVAALLVFFALPSPPADLPEYSFEVSGGDQPVRGTVEPPAATRVLSSGSRLEVVARPPVDVGTDVGATVFVRSAEGLQRVPTGPEVAASGSVRWSGTAGEAPLLPGVDQVILVVYPDGTSSDAVREAAGAPGGLQVGEGLQVHAVPVSITR